MTAKRKYSVEVVGDCNMFSSKKFGFFVTIFLRLFMSNFVKNAEGAIYVTNNLLRRFSNYKNTLVASNVNIKNIFLKKYRNSFN